MYTTLHDAIDDTAGHGLGIGDHDAAKPYVHDLLPLAMRRIDEFD